MVDFLQAMAQHLTGKDTKEAQRRAEICAACPDKETRSYAKILEAKMVEINGFVCLECSCPLATKIHAKEENNICPKWR